MKSHKNFIKPSYPPFRTDFISFCSISQKLTQICERYDAEYQGDFEIHFIVIDYIMSRHTPGVNIVIKKIQRNRQKIELEFFILSLSHRIKSPIKWRKNSDCDVDDLKQRKKLPKKEFK